MKVHEFNGVHESSGYIAEILDEASGAVNKAMTRGNIIMIQGYGLKIESDAEYEKGTGFFFIPPTGKAGTIYTISVVTMSGISGGGTILKQPREISSDFKLPVS